MADRFGRVIAGLVDGLVTKLVVPVTSVIPRLVERGVLFVAFALLWGAFAVALLANPAGLGDLSAWLGQQSLPVQALAWLLFLPVTAGLWVHGTDWPLVVRLVVIAGLAGWNLLIFLPRRADRAAQASVVGEV